MLNGHEKPLPLSSPPHERTDTMTSEGLFYKGRHTPEITVYAKGKIYRGLGWRGTPATLGKDSSSVT